MPKFAPELIRNTLFGPGVIAAARAKRKAEIARSGLIVEILGWYPDAYKGYKNQGQE